MKRRRSRGSLRSLAAYQLQAWVSRLHWQSISPHLEHMRTMVRKSPWVCERRAPMRRLILIAAFLVGPMVSTAGSADNPRANLGVLTCTLVKPAQDTAHKMTCGFKPAGTG